MAYVIQQIFTDPSVFVVQDRNAASCLNAAGVKIQQSSKKTVKASLTESYGADYNTDKGKDGNIPGTLRRKPD